MDGDVSTASPSMMATDHKDEMRASDELEFHEEPQNWSVQKKILVSLGASGHTFALLYGATAYTAGVKDVMAEFDVSMTHAVVPFSLYIWGIFFAPIYSPHMSERLGRNPGYVLSTLGLAVFTLGAAYSRTFVQLGVCRFFAGLFAGSNVVQIEGTYADVWPALYTSSYYVFIAGTQYFGAAVGAIVNWHVVPAKSWRWTQYTTLMFALAALLLGAGMPETYRRKLIRQRAARLNKPNTLEPAPTGTSLRVMAKLTLLHPLIMFFTQPIVTMISLYLALNFGVLFSWFISVPAVLQGVADYTPQQVGSAFGTAIGGTAAAMLSTFAIDQVTVRLLRARKSNLDIEHRLFPAMFGAALITASLFWVGWTANKSFKPQVPVVGNGFYVWGSAMTVIPFISYLFDAYPRQGTLSALTVAACMRLALAGLIPLIIIIGITNIGGDWVLSTFGFISIPFLTFPFFIFFFGKKLRTSSSFYESQYMTPMQIELEIHQRNMSGDERGHLGRGKIDR